MFNKIVFSNYYLRKRRDLKKDGKASYNFEPYYMPMQNFLFAHKEK